MYMETRCPQKHKEYTRLRNRVKNLTRKASIRHEKEIASNVKENPKRFWNLVQAKTRIKEKIPDLTRADGTTTTTDGEKAQALNECIYWRTGLRNPNRILHTMEEITEAVDLGLPLDAVLVYMYIDLMKAFDTVPHQDCWKKN